MKTKTTGTEPLRQTLIESFSIPLGDAKIARNDIHTASGNLEMDELPGSEELLASGTLEYTEKQGLPSRTLEVNNGEAILSLRSDVTERRWFRFPWAACNEATQWQIHLNRNVKSDINAKSGGGNVRLNLSGLVVTHVLADAGAGNLGVILPDQAQNIDVVAKTGAGNVEVTMGQMTTGSNKIYTSSGAGNVNVNLPDGIAARIHAKSGMGRITMDGRFTQIDKTTYQSPDFDLAANKVEITASSGAGNVSISIK